ncbi:hypothetical protein BDZ45DRAFT_312429 [Acephala macrosclerotiorum]|nr:hypothetical protein BDZ45DRAFT_312429 [Acephala macrosclerotiorum]
MKKAIEVAGNVIENRQVFVGHGGHLLMFPIRGEKETRTCLIIREPNLGVKKGGGS